MKTYREFIVEQQKINEIGPIGAALMGAMALWGVGGKAYKKVKDKIKGYKESQKEKKDNAEKSQKEKKDNAEYGYDINVKTYNPNTKKEETLSYFIDPKKPDPGNDDLGKMGIKFGSEYKNPNNDDIVELEKEAGNQANRFNREIKVKVQRGESLDDMDLPSTMKPESKDQKPEPEKQEPTPEPEDQKPEPEKQEPTPEPEDQKPEPEKQEPEGTGVKLPRDYVGKDIKDIPDDMKDDVANLERKKLKNTKDVENHMKRWGLDRVVGWTKKRGSSGMPGDYEYVQDSFILNFSSVLYEDLRSDLQKMTKSKTDGEVTLADGTSIPIEPLTAQILVKYIDSLDSSEKKKIINQLQRTERGFMKVLGKAHEV